MRGIVGKMTGNAGKKVLIFFTWHQVSVRKHGFPEIGKIRIAAAVYLYRNSSFRLEKIMFRLYQIKHAQPPYYTTLEGAVHLSAANSPLGYLRRSGRLVLLSGNGQKWPFSDA